MFKGTPPWEEVTEDDKIKSVFMINRFMSRHALEKVSHLNTKGQDVVTSMELWSLYFNKHHSPYDFWARSSYKSSDNEYKEVAQKIGLDKVGDVEYIKRWYPEEYSEIIKEIENKKKQK
jgi:hypothetical protein